MSRDIEDVLVYFRELIREAVAGELSDNDVKTNMLNHASGSEAVDTGAIRDGAVTNAKLAGSISSDKITSVLASAISGTISNSQLAGSITYDKLAGAIRASQLYGDIPADKLVDEFNVTTFANKLSGAIPVTKGGWRGRLMGFDDESFDKAAQVNSNTQLYKQAGNSIVVDVLMKIFEQML